MKTKFKTTNSSYITLFLAAIIFFSCKEKKVENKDIVASDSELKLISKGYSFTEGPAVDKSGNIYFTDQPNDKIFKINTEDNSVSEYMSPAGRANGLYFDTDDNLYVAAEDQNELWKIGKNKEVTVLVDNFDGKKFNGPNDIWIDAKGGVYFTDPYYQRDFWKHTEPQQTAKRVYYLDPNTNSLRVAADDNFSQPNGIIGSKDGKTLFISDHGDEKIFSFEVDKNGNLSNKKLFIDMGSDGMTLDNLGNLYATGNGVTVFNSKGEKIKHISIPENWTSNVTFGGKNQETLFITAMGSVYTLKMNVHGIR